jgi:hypothetical protein
MPNIPTIATMEKRGFSREQATAIRAEMESFHRKHWKGGVIPRNTLERINSVINGHGVESIARGHNDKSPRIEYVNMGDSYATTILWTRGRFSVGCWGDIVERGNYD